nr:MAG TPA: hypothetical protein [Caudoviricetes sp.]
MVNPQWMRWRLMGLTPNRPCRPSEIHDSSQPPVPPSGRLGFTHIFPMGDFDGGF